MQNEEREREKAKWDQDVAIKCIFLSLRKGSESSNCAYWVTAAWIHPQPQDLFSHCGYWAHELRHYGRRSGVETHTCMSRLLEDDEGEVGEGASMGWPKAVGSVSNCSAVILSLQPAGSCVVTTDRQSPEWQPCSLSLSFFLLFLIAVGAPSPTLCVAGAL